MRRAFVAAVLAAVGLLLARRAVAQAPQPCPAVEGALQPRCAVDTLPRLAAGTPWPRYPDLLRQAGVSGTVHVRFIVDTTGLYDRTSLEVIEASHDLFVHAVRAPLPGWRFAPARLNGQLVRTRVEYVFEFHADTAGPRVGITVSAPDTIANGVIRVFIGQPPRDDNALAYFAPAELLATQREVLRQLAREIRGREKVATLCLTMRSGEARVSPDSLTLTALRESAPSVVPQSACPRTYASMFEVVDSLGRPVDPRPPGWIDPHRLVVTRVVPWTRDLLRIDAIEAEGTGEISYECAVVRLPTRAWAPTCDAVRWIVH